MVNIKIKQPRIFKQIQTSFRKKQNVHAYLFEGTAGAGKKEMALWCAKFLFCLQPTINSEPCEECLNCQRINNTEHPDIVNIQPDGQTIKVDQIRNIKSSFIKSGMETKQKVLIIDDADKMTVSAANSLLKFIEEPEGEIVIFLLTEAKAKILPTIQSRCQVYHFSAVPTQVFEKQLLEKGISSQQAKQLVQITNSLKKAVEIYQQEWFNDVKEAADKWFMLLLNKDDFAFVYVQQKIVKIFKEKEQQNLLFDLLIAKFRKEVTKQLKNNDDFSMKEQEQQWTQKHLVEAIEIILENQKKILANVSFQNICEQLSLRLVQ